jgi:pantetheine-phosphate adenylyltransferase
MTGMNGALAPDLETLFLPAAAGNRHIAATFVRQIAQMGGDVSFFVPPSVVQLLKSKLTPSTAS